jgi:hypothetical protein
MIKGWERSPMEDLNIIFYFYMSIVIIEVNSNLMEVEEKNSE